MKVTAICGVGSAALAIGLGLAGVSPALSGGTNGEDMKPKVVQQKAFTVVGIAARTNNAREATDSFIRKQWGRLMQENLLAKIPNKADSNIVAVYTNYASNKDGDYTYILGARVTKDAPIPDGMVTTTVPTGRYAVFTSERGPVQQVVVATWKRIWATPKNEPGGDRAYKADFELYGERAKNPADSVMEIYIGIR